MHFLKRGEKSCILDRELSDTVWFIHFKISLSLIVTN